MTDPGRPIVVQGLLDTSIVITLEFVPAASLPPEPAISAITLVELAASPAVRERSTF